MREVCGDCGQMGPCWASVNRGILLCDDCCSVHRNLGRQISYIKSLQKEVWSPSLLLMFETLSRAGANNVWEHSLLDIGNTNLHHKPSPTSPLHPTKEEFIKAKHEDLEFVLRTDQDVDGTQGLGSQLHAAARTPDLLTSLRLFSQGADPNFFHKNKGSTPLHVAAKCNQLLQAELLIVNGADVNIKDSNGLTAEECARDVGHLALADRLNEIKYHVIDRLARFLCSRKPGLVNRQYEYLPEFLNSLDRVGSNQEANSKLQMLPNSLFEKLVSDVFDEVDRREVENCSSTTSPTLSVLFLPVHQELSSPRNQARQKLGTFSNIELCSLIYDLLRDAKRRETVCHGYQHGLFDTRPRTLQQSQLLTPKLKSEISDDEPLYDSVASDDDYVSAERLTLERQRQDDVQRLQTKVTLLQSTIDFLVKENRELREELLRCKTTREHDVEQVVAKSTRPSSMYETREGLRTVQQNICNRPPRKEDVARRTEQVTKRIQELWKCMKEDDIKSFVPCAERIRIAVCELSAIFNQYTQEELVRDVCMYTDSLQVECSALQTCSIHERTNGLQQVRNYAYSIAKANKLLVIKYVN